MPIEKFVIGVTKPIRTKSEDKKIYGAIPLLVGNSEEEKKTHKIVVEKGPRCALFFVLAMILFHLETGRKNNKKEADSLNK